MRQKKEDQESKKSEMVKGGKERNLESFVVGREGGTRRDGPGSYGIVYLTGKRDKANKTLSGRRSANTASSRTRNEMKD